MNYDSDLHSWKFKCNTNKIRTMNGLLFYSIDIVSNSSEVFNHLVHCCNIEIMNVKEMWIGDDSTVIFEVLLRVFWKSIDIRFACTRLMNPKKKLIYRG